MTTVRQINANRRNAQKSTGPTSDEGKAASRRNALKHGLSASVETYPEESEAVRVRMIEWRPLHQPQNAEEEWYFEQFVMYSVRLDRCKDERNALEHEERRRAANGWEDDRRDEVVKIASKLSKHPQEIYRRLHSIKQGAEWLLNCWRALGQILDREGEWTEPQNSLAQDLIGTKLELRGLAPLGDPGILVRNEIFYLERRLNLVLDERDEQERQAAERGVPFAPSRALLNLRRHEATLLRNYLWAQGKFQESCRKTPPPDPPYVPSHPPQTAPTNQTQCDSGQDEPIPTGFDSQPWIESQPSPRSDSSWEASFDAVPRPLVKNRR